MKVGDTLEGFVAAELPPGARVRHPRGMVLEKQPDGQWAGPGFGPGRLRFDTHVEILHLPEATRS